MAVVADASTLALDGVIDAALAGRTGELDCSLARRSPPAPLPAPSSRRRCAKWRSLHRARLAVEDGASVSEAAAASSRSFISAARPRSRRRSGPGPSAARAGNGAARGRRARSAQAARMADSIAQRTLLARRDRAAEGIAGAGAAGRVAREKSRCACFVRSPAAFAAGADMRAGIGFAAKSPPTLTAVLSQQPSRWSSRSDRAGRPTCPRASWHRWCSRRWAERGDREPAGGGRRAWQQSVACRARRRHAAHRPERDARRGARAHEESRLRSDPELYADRQDRRQHVVLVVPSAYSANSVQGSSPTPRPIRSKLSSHAAGVGNQTQCSPSCSSPSRHRPRACPYKSGAEMVTAILSEQVQMAFPDVSILSPLIREESSRRAVTSAATHPQTFRP